MAPMSPLGIAGFLTGALSVWWYARQNVWAWPAVTTVVSLVAQYLLTCTVFGTWDGSAGGPAGGSSGGPDAPRPGAVTA